MKTLKWVYFDWKIWVLDTDYQDNYSGSVINSPYGGWIRRNWIEKELKENFVKNYWYYVGNYEERNSFNVLVCPKTWEYIFPWDKVRVEWRKNTEVYINSKEDRFYTDYWNWAHRKIVPSFITEEFSINDCWAYLIETNFEFVAHYDWERKKYLPDWESIMAKEKREKEELTEEYIYDINNIRISLWKYKLETVLKFLEDNFEGLYWVTGEKPLQWMPNYYKIMSLLIENGTISWGEEKEWVPFKKIKEYFNNKKSMEISFEWTSGKIEKVELEKLKQEKDRLEGKLHSSILEAEMKSETLKIKEEELEKIKKEMKELKKIKETYKPVGRSSLWDNVILSDLNYKKLQLSWQEKIPLLLEWPSGTGKSTIVRTLAEDNKTPFVEFNFNGDTTVEHLLWHKVLVGVKSSKESPMAWEDWPLTDAVRNGKVFLAHELNASSPEIQFILNGLLELKNWELGNLTVQGNNWEVIKAHPNFRFYGTYNRGYLWTKSFGTSIMSRFIWIRIDPLKKEEEASLLDKKYPWNEVAINLLVRLEEVLRGKKDFTYDISTRDIEQALLFIRNWFWYRDSIEATIEQSLQIGLEKKILWEEFDKIFTS